MFLYLLSSVISLYLERKLRNEGDLNQLSTNYECDSLIANNLIATSDITLHQICLVIFELPQLRLI